MPDLDGLGRAGGGGVSAPDVGDEMARMRALVDRARPAPGPVRGSWSLGVGDVLANHPAAPARLRGLIRKLDSYGGLAISDRAVAFDGKEVAWSQVTEIRTHGFVEYLLSGALSEQMRSLPIPWFPGRQKLLEVVSKALLTLVFTAAREQLNRHEEIRIPAAIRYRGRTREQSMSPGIVAALLLADPTISQCLLATAAERGVPTSNDGSEWTGDAEARAAQLRSRLAGLEASLSGWRLGSDDPGPAAQAPAAASRYPESPESYPMSEPPQPLFSSGHDGGYDPQRGPTGYPQIGRPGPAEPSVRPGGPAIGSRVTPRNLWIAGIVLAVVTVVVVAVFLLTGQSADGGSAGSDTAQAAEQTTDAPTVTKPPGGDSPPRASVPPPLIQSPDTYGEACGNGFNLAGRDGWATHAGRGSAETSCRFAHNVLLAYWNQYGSPSVEPRTIAAPGTVPCPTTGGQCAGDDFLMDCTVLGADPWITCTGGRNARVYLY